MTRRWALASAGTAATALMLFAVLGSTPASLASTTNRTVPVQLLAINDLHGNIEPVGGSAGAVTTAIDPVTGAATTVPAGGLAYLATHLKQARAANSLTVGVGDLIGGSPLLSALFHDEPTIEALKLLGLKKSAVGNHEFDDGKAELLRINNGGCHPVDGCVDPGQPYKGAGLYLGANVFDSRTHRPLLPPLSIQTINGATIAFVGVTLEDTPSVVSASGVAGVRFTDEVVTINRYAKLLKLIGINAVVALVHEGGKPASPVYDYDCDASGPGSGLSGPIVEIARNLDPAVDVVLTGHSHEAYVCTIPDPAGQPRLVSQGASFGRLFTDVRFNYDKRTRDIVRSSVTARNVVVSRDVAPDPAMTELIAKYSALVAPVANRIVGHIAADIPGRGATTPERPLGNLIADATLEYTAPAAKGGAVIGITNPGGLRADLAYAASGAEGNGVVTYAEAFAVQPFYNNLVSLDLTGQQLATVLGQQFTGINAASPRYLQISSSLAWTADLSQTGAARVVVGSIKVNGTPIDPAATYRITMNSFLAGGGDGFTEFVNGTNRLVGDLDIEPFVTYLAAHSSPTAPLTPPPLNRITFV